MVLAKSILYVIIVLGLSYQCPKCRTHKSIFADNIFFKESKSKIRDILIVMFCWSANLGISHTRHIIPMDKNTIVQWFQYCRDITSNR